MWSVSNIYLCIKVDCNSLAQLTFHVHKVLLKCWIVPSTSTLRLHDDIAWEKIRLRAPSPLLLKIISVVLNNLYRLWNFQSLRNFTYYLILIQFYFLIFNNFYKFFAKAPIKIFHKLLWLRRTWVGVRWSAQLHECLSLSNSWKASPCHNPRPDKS